MPKGGLRPDSATKEDNMFINSANNAELTMHDATTIVNRKSASMPCRVECDITQLAVIKEACETEDRLQRARSQGKGYWRRIAALHKRFPRADATTLVFLADKSPQLLFDRISQVPLNLLTQPELSRLRISRQVESDRVLVEDQGATIVPLFWAITAPNRDLSHVITPPTRTLAKLAKQIVGIREEKELERLSVIWKSWGLPPLVKRAKAGEVYRTLLGIGRLVGEVRI
jgi:hypothetical protein